MSEFTTEDIRIICAGLLCYRDRMFESVKELQGRAVMPHTLALHEEREQSLLKDAKHAQALCQALWSEGGVEREEQKEKGDG